jgi:K+:H+ antiporter subunit KhtT
MTVDLRETRLPGVGTKFSMHLDHGARLAVILHNDGKRELYYFGGHDEDPRAVITLDDDQARQLGAVLGGAYERPKIVEELELALGELQIEWVAVPDDSPWLGKSLAECAFRARTGITVIAILREPEPVTGAQPSDVLQRGDRLVTVGKAGQYLAFRRLLASKDPTVAAAPPGRPFKRDHESD